MKFSLKAAGEEYQSVERIDIASVNLKDARTGQKVDVDNNIITLSAQETERAVIEVETSDSVSNVAFKMGVVR